MDQLLDTQPTLFDEHVALRPLGANDWDALYAVARDPLIWEQHPFSTRWREPVFRGYFEDALASGGALVVIDRATDAIIGASRYDFDRAEPGEVEIGWTFIARQYWGGPTNRAIKRLMIGHALKTLPRTVFLVGETNQRSRRAMEKIGGVLLNRQQVFNWEGADIIHVIYAVDRDGFATGPLATG